MMNVEIFSLVTFVMQFFKSVDVVVKYKCNVFAYVEGKIEACDCQ